MGWRTRTLHHLRRDDSGVALVEFGLILPLMLLFFALAIEGGRTFWAYQTAIAGVRDAARYVSHATPSNVCSTGGNLNGLNTKVTDIVKKNISGTSAFPGQITIVSVTPLLTCVSGTYRLTPTPVVTVTATMTIAYPFSGLFTLSGQTAAGVTTTVTDRARIFGT